MKISGNSKPFYITTIVKNNVKITLKYDVQWFSRPIITRHNVLLHVLHIKIMQWVYVTG